LPGHCRCGGSDLYTIDAIAPQQHARQSSLQNPREDAMIVDAQVPLWLGTLLLGYRSDQLISQGQLSAAHAHFTETLDFLSNEDKEWVMGRAILERLGWK
jgi:hypothetical protein